MGFGLMPIFATLAYRAGMTIITVLFLRFLLAAILMAPVAVWQLRSLGRRLTRRDVVSALAMGGVLYTGEAVLYFAAVKALGASLAAVMLYLYPAAVALVECAMHRVRPRALLVLALVGSIVGVALSVGRIGAGSTVGGLVLGVAAAVVYVIYVLVGDRLVGGMPTLTMSAFMFAGATLGLGLSGLVLGQLRLDFAPLGWVWAASLTVAASLVGIVCFFLGMARLGATRASIGSTLEPVTTLVVSALVLGTVLTPWQYVGALLVVASAVLGVAMAPRPHDADDVKGP